jgi:hypothetical protein
MPISNTRPQARKDNLFIREMESGEAVVYDGDRKRAHCLNPTVATVWRHCDGNTSIADLAGVLSRKAGVPADESLVWLSLGELTRAHLVDVPGDGPFLRTMTRRRAVAQLGTGAAAVALPLIISIAAPKPAAAASCLQSGAACTVGSQCCSGFCLPNWTCA